MEPMLQRMKLLIDEMHECADDESLTVEDFAYVAQDNIHELKKLFDQYLEEPPK
jgi:hypothetical protein